MQVIFLWLVNTGEEKEAEREREKERERDRSSAAEHTSSPF